MTVPRPTVQTATALRSGPGGCRVPQAPSLRASPWPGGIVPAGRDRLCTACRPQRPRQKLCALSSIPERCFPYLCSAHHCFSIFNLYISLQQLFALSNKVIRCWISCGGSCTCLSVVRSSFDRGLVMMPLLYPLTWGRLIAHVHVKGARGVPLMPLLPLYHHVR